MTPVFALCILAPASSESISAQGFRPLLMNDDNLSATQKGGKLQDLPPELSTQILRECVPRTMNRKGRFLFLMLRTLCSQWREICYSTPEFWSNLTIDFDEEREAEDGKKMKQVLQSARGWYNRSGLGPNLGLSAAEDTSLLEDEVHLFAQFVHEHASRWKTLELEVSDTVLMFVLLMPRQPVEWPTLHSLQVTMHGRFVDMRFLNLMPSLRHLQLELIGVDIPTSSQITYLEITAFDPFFPGLSLPSLYPSLTTLTLRFLDPCTVDAETSTFESLERLNLVGEMDVLGLLDRFICPVLRGFSFEFHQYDFEGEELFNHNLEHYRVVDFLRRSQKPIRSLRLSLAIVQQYEGQEIRMARQLLKLLNGSLEELDLGQWPWSGSSTEFEDIPSLPHLHTLSIAHVSRDEGESLVGWLLQRAEGLAPSTTEAKDTRRWSPFPRLYLTVEKERAGFPEDEVSRLVEEGADLYLRRENH